MTQDPALERQGRRLGRPAWHFLLAALLLAIPGVILIALNTAVGLGIAFVLIASVPAAVGVALLGASIVTRWSARQKPFA